MAMTFANDDTLDCGNESGMQIDDMHLDRIVIIHKQIHL